MINEEKYVEFIIDNKLTQPQFLLLHLIHKKRYDLIDKYKKAFPTGDNTIIGRLDTNILLEKGLLINDNGVPKVSKEFKKFYTNDIETIDEIYNIYPDFLIKENGVKVPLTSVDRTLFRKMYFDKIMYSNEEHKEVIKDIEYGVKNDLIKMGLGKFLSSEYWKVLRKLRKKAVNSTPDNILTDDGETFE